MIAVFVALIIGAKMAIPIPNVEIVTLLFVVFTLVFGWLFSFIASFFFVAIEILIWGFNPAWVILYFIYWPILVSIVGLVRLLFIGLKEKQKKRLKKFVGPLQEKYLLPKIHISQKRQMVMIIVTVVLAVALTVLFGALSVLIEVLVWQLGGVIQSGRFWIHFYYRYLSGIPFFIIHIVNNAIVLPLLVPPLYIALSVAKRELKL